LALQRPQDAIGRGMRQAAGLRDIDEFQAARRSGGQQADHVDCPVDALRTIRVAPVRQARNRGSLAGIVDCHAVLSRAKVGRRSYGPCPGLRKPGASRIPFNAATGAAAWPIWFSQTWNWAAAARYRGSRR